MNRITSSLAYNELKYSGQHKNQKNTIVDVLIYYPKGLSLREICEKTGFDIKNIYKDFTFSKKLNVKKPEYIAILKKIKWKLRKYMF